MTAGFLLLLGVFFVWVAVTSRGRAMMEAVTGIQWTNPHSSSS